MWHDPWESQYPLEWIATKHYLGLSDEEIECIEAEYWRWKEQDWHHWNEAKWRRVMGIAPAVSATDDRVDAGELKERADLVEVAQFYMQLREHGGEWSGKCPFHEDRLPSFSINRKKQLWTCYAGCGGGDVYAFLMRAENISFKEAVRLLAKSL